MNSPEQIEREDTIFFEDMQWYNGGLEEGEGGLHWKSR